MKRFYMSLFIFLIFMSTAGFSYSSIQNLKINNEIVDAIQLLSDSINMNKQFDFSKVKNDIVFNNIKQFEKQDLIDLVKIIHPNSNYIVDSLKEQYELCNQLAKTFLYDSAREQRLSRILENQFHVENQQLAINKIQKYIQNLLFNNFLSHNWDVKIRITKTFCQQQTSREIDNLIDYFTDDMEFQDQLFFVIRNYSTNIYNNHNIK